MNSHDWNMAFSPNSSNDFLGSSRTLQMVLVIFFHISILPQSIFGVFFNNSHNFFFSHFGMFVLTGFLSFDLVIHDFSGCFIHIAVYPNVKNCIWVIQKKNGNK